MPAQELRLAVRRLRETPAFTLFAILTLALGIGATTAVYSMVRAVTGPPRGVRAPGEILNVYHVDAANGVRIRISWGDFLDLEARQTVFSGLTAWSFFRQAYAANGQSDTAFGEIVDGNYFSTLGVQAAAGRTLAPADARAARRQWSSSAIGFGSVCSTRDPRRWGRSSG